MNLNSDDYFLLKWFYDSSKMMINCKENLIDNHGPYTTINFTSWYFFP